jgi:biotin carboxyl carrier protein
VSFRLAAPPDIDRAVKAAGINAGAGTSDVVAPMPGAIIAIHHRTGDRVDAGDPLVTLEAMKMEHVVAAPIAGILAALRAAPGDQVARGQLLAIVEPGQ